MFFKGRDKTMGQSPAGAGDEIRLPVYKEIAVPVDNSRYSNYTIEVAADLARRFGAQVSGLHVYAARLHDERFRQMEAGLPEEYQEPKELERQRKIHDSLITKGLQIISDSFLDVLAEKCKGMEINYIPKRPEGKNYAELVKDIRESGYDLVVMGVKGLGDVEGCVIGSVCERVVRRVDTDVLVIKGEVPIGGTIVAAIDGSPQSFYGLTAALRIAAARGARVVAVAAYDPHYHVVAFRSMEGVLSAEAGKIFRFKEQEQLHNEIIDKGIAKIYSDHLDTARDLAARAGVEIETILLEGKPFAAIMDYLRRIEPSLLVVGRLGVHADEGLDIGATAENLLRFAPCHVLLAAGRLHPPVPEEKIENVAEAPLAWSEDALETMKRVPPFARGFARKMVEEYARKHGYPLVTPEVIQDARRKMGMP